MVLLPITPRAVKQAIEIAQQQGSILWVGSDAIDVEEHRRLVALGLNVTRFAYPLANMKSEDLDEIISTIEEHHPDEPVWVGH